MRHVVTAMLIAIALPAVAQEGEAFCSLGSIKLRLGRGPDAIAEAARICRTGDILYIPGNATLEIGSLCDFSRTIVLQPDGLMLCMAKLPPRPQRKAG